MSAKRSTWNIHSQSRSEINPKKHQKVYLTDSTKTFRSVSSRQSIHFEFCLGPGRENECGFEMLFRSIHSWMIHTHPQFSTDSATTKNPDWNYYHLFEQANDDYDLYLRVTTPWRGSQLIPEGYCLHTKGKGNSPERRGRDS